MIAHKAYPSISDQQVLIKVSQNNKLAINCTKKQYLDGMKSYRAGAYMQDAFDFLQPEEREFLMSGISPKQWARFFSKESEGVGG